MFGVGEKVWSLGWVFKKKLYGGVLKYEQGYIGNCISFTIVYNVCDVLEEFVLVFWVNVEKCPGERDLGVRKFFLEFGLSFWEKIVLG